MQKLAGVEDLRVRRTRKLLQQALIEGSLKKGFAALTVRDITEYAMVNRSTFYRHYLDKYDLLEHHIQELYEALGVDGEIAGKDCSARLIELLTQIQQFSDFYRVVLGAQADTFLSQHFCQQTQQRFLAHFQQTFPAAATDPGAPPLELKFTTVGSAVCGALTWWLEQEQPSTPEQFALWLQQLISGILVQYPQSGSKNASVSARAR
ncbi:TetR/AcrR family transcriptional regulator [Ktedonobacter racemifer]|uniref:Transcriptional regulator, TetR family n=1 Tax=Ktedonobacter racemifer DSM 44963 TaxID=485913 RepID=D6TUN1_KTERA|nr:TetR/AcrR family transcriptional regulator [Ktedonobacter racemifer]EFH84099.1 transcriptional regulator, TetR family [Ktedonobacter racemifer DSM 44963]